MKVVCLDFVEGARLARGSAVIIDVFRAATTAAFAAARGATVVPVAAIDDAIGLRARHPEWLLAGERHARDLPGFDFGNSPARISASVLSGRTLVHTTHSGTQGLVSANLADEVLTGSLANAAAIVRYLNRKSPAVVSLVRMGWEARERCIEDDICAELIEARLLGRPYDTSAIAGRLRAAPSAQKFFDPAADWAPEADFPLCATLDRFDFVLRLRPADADGVRALERIPA